MEVEGVGALIRRRRLSLGLTQEEVEERTGVDQSHMSQIELGEVVKPRESTLLKISHGLGIPFDDLRVAAGHLKIVTVDEPIRLSELPRVPFLGRVPADYMRWTAAVDEQQDFPVWPEWLEEAADPAVVQASGDCLIERDVRSGDWVLIDRDATPARGDIVVVRVRDEVTMKEWHPVKGGIELRASSDRYKPIFVSYDEEGVEVIGVARRAYREIAL